MRSYLVVLGLLFIALGRPSSAENVEPESEVVVAEGDPLAVKCFLRVEQRAEWRREGGAPPPDMLASEAARGGRLTASLDAPAAHARHAGVYTCARGPTAQRVRVRVLPAPAAGAAPTPPPLPQPARDVLYDVRSRNIAFNCSSAANIDPTAAVFAWQKNGTAVEELADLKGRYKVEERASVLTITDRSTEDDFGNYTCLADGAPAYSFRLRGRTVARIDEDHSVVEGQKIKLKCRIVGKPYPPVQWTFLATGAAAGDNASEARDALGADRVSYAPNDAGVADATLVLEQARLADAGNYSCAPVGGAPAFTTLRVKDMYAALWPFLGICIEVFILCAIILVYEKRRTKPEHEDSDTDNHEQ